jgi:hypothetical protein
MQILAISTWSGMAYPVGVGKESVTLSFRTPLSFSRWHNKKLNSGVAECAFHANVKY